MGAHTAAKQPRRQSAKHRAASEQKIQRYTWLGAGAITLGIGAAMASAGTASAETDGGDTTNADAAERPSSDKASSAADPKPNPESTVGSGREEDGGEDGESGSDTTPNTSSPETRSPATSLSATGGNVRTAIKDAVKTAQTVGENVADKLAATAAPDPEPETEPATERSAALAFLRYTAPNPEPDIQPEPDVQPEPLDFDLDLAAEADAEPEAAAGPVPWSPNPFRPMPPEPAPNDMPGLVWNVEQTIVDAFQSVPVLQPFVREGFELGFRATQMIPWVNAVIPVVNVVDQLPNLASGDPMIVRDATQRIINNLIVTVHPVSVLYYGYDAVADLINLEYEAQVLKEWFYATTWDILDPFELLHNRGVSGLPMSPSSPSAVTLAASARAMAPTTDEPGSNPFRAVDPDPNGMPEGLLQARNVVIALLPDELDPIFREAYEAVYRGSQMVPYVNAVIPITEILPALALALAGEKWAAQVAINQLILTTSPVSVLYYGYDQIADLLNVEQAAATAKAQLYSGIWDLLDPAGVLHDPGESGLPILL